MPAIIKIKSQTFVFPDQETADEVIEALKVKHPDLEYQIMDSEMEIEDVIAESVPSDPIMAYVLMRTDVPGYLSGKAMAQSNHAGTMMVFKAYNILSEPDAVGVHPIRDLMLEWEKEGGGFGTCIVLKVTGPEMRQAVSLAKLMGIHAGIVHDPSYPVFDGEKVQTIPLDTCAFVFGRKSDCSSIVGRFPLLRGKDE